MTLSLLMIPMQRKFFLKLKIIHIKYCTSFDVWCGHCMFGVEIEDRFRLGTTFRPD
jgi:hypothetical protein